MNYLIITRVKTFNIRTLTCLAGDQGGVEGGQEAGDLIEGLGLKIDGLEAGLLSLEY